MFGDDPYLSLFCSDDLKADISAWLLLLSPGIDSAKIEAAVRHFSVCKTDFATFVAGHSRGGGLAEDCKEACVSLQADVVNQRELVDLAKITISLGDLDPNAADAMVSLSAAVTVVGEYKSQLILILQTASQNLRDNKAAAITKLPDDFVECEASAVDFQRSCYWLRFGKIVADIGGIMTKASSQKDIANLGVALRAKPLSRALSDPGELGMQKNMGSEALDKHKADMHNLRSLLAAATKFFDSLQVDGGKCVVNLSQGDPTGFLALLFSFDMPPNTSKYLSYDTLKGQVAPLRMCVHSLACGALEDLISTQLKVEFGSMTTFLANNANNKKFVRFPWRFSH